jgi:hypothetical protein
MKQKYIVAKDIDGEEQLFKFPLKVNHDNMWKCIQYLRKDPDTRHWHRMFCDVKPVSAGFISETGICSGRSESLNIDSRPKEDTALATR